MVFDVFISYSHEDQKDAELLCTELDNAGITYWIDKNIHGSVNFLTEITEKIRQCKVVIFIASSSSAKSIFTQKEILFAFKHNKTIVPYKLEKFTFEHNPELDFLFTNIQWIEKLDVLVADVYKLCNNKEYFCGKTNSRNSILTFYKKHCRILILSGIFITTTIMLLAILDKGQYELNDNLKTDNIEKNSIAEKEKSKLTIIEEFENTPEPPISERVDIINLIETFMIDKDAGYNVQGWSVFQEYTKTRRLIPLSKGLESNMKNIAPFTLEFVSKLTLNKENLDSDIFGQSRVQSISLYGSRIGASLLVIDSRNLSYNICSDFIIQDLNFACTINLSTLGDDISIYKREEYLIVEIYGGGSGGTHYQWIVSNDKCIIIDYIKYMIEDEEKATYIQTALSENGDNYARRYGWRDDARVFDRPVIIGNISKIEIEHKEDGEYDKATYTFNKKGDVICVVNYNEYGTIKSTLEYEYDLTSNNVRLKENGEYSEYQFPYITTDDLAFKSESIYDNNGNIIQTQDYIHGKQSTLTKYKYDKQNNLIEILYIFTNSSQKCHTYKYDESQNIIEERIEETDKPIVKINYEYDDRGNVVSLTRIPGRYSTLPSTTTYKITYR